jgi:hypothetical protein
MLRAGASEPKLIHDLTSHRTGFLQSMSPEFEKPKKSSAVLLVEGCLLLILGTIVLGAAVSIVLYIISQMF